MKQNYILSRSRLLLLSFFTALFGSILPASADEITVCEGTETSQYVPFAGYYADMSSQKTEFIIPASKLSSVSGATFTQMKFYLSSVSTKTITSTYRIFLKEVEESEFSVTTSWGSTVATAIGDAGATSVYSGRLDFTASTMNIEFVEPFEYGGGNLLVGIYVVSAGSAYADTSFKGENSSNGSWTCYSSSSGNKAFDFIPQTTFTYESATEGPRFAVFDSGVKVDNGYEYNFGLTDGGATKSFTVKNSGTEALSISVGTTGGFTSDITSATVEAKGETTITVSMPSETATGSITITPNYTGLEAVTINLSGTVKDPEKIFIDFEEASLPSTWSFDSGWSVSTGGYATIGYYGAYIRSGVISTDEGGEDLFFKYRGNSTWTTGQLKVYWATTGNDGSADWTEVTSFTPAPENNVWKDAIYRIPAEAKYIAIYGQYMDIDDIYGLKEPTVAIMEFTPADYSFGLITEAKTSETFTVKNTGKGTLTGLSVTSNDENFLVSVTDNATSIAAKSEVTFTVTMKADVKGAHSGVITVEADGFDNKTFAVSGYVLDNDAYLVTFDDNQKPEGWEDSNISYSDGAAVAAYGNYTERYLITPSLTVADGDVMAINAKLDYSSGWLRVLTSTDGKTWNQIKQFTSSDLSTTDYSVVYISGVPAGSYKFKLQGSYAYIDLINGFHLNEDAPALTVTPTDAAAFGKVKAQPAAKTYIVSNSGTGTLTGTISSDNAAFTVSESTFSLGKGESLSFDVNLVFDDNYGEKAATITIHPTNDGLADVTIAATATTADPSIWEEDFESGSIPSTWTNDGWTASTSNYGNNGTYMAYAGTSGGNALITPRLYATEGQTLTFEVGSGTDNTDQLTVEYSNDRVAWTAIEGSPITAAGTYTFTAPADGYYFLRFTGRYAGLDNFYGFKEAPADHDAVVSAVDVPAAGAQYVEYTASVTVTEKAGKDEELTARFFIGETQCGETVTETVEANGTKTFIVSFTPDAPVSGEAYFTLTNADLSLESTKTTVSIAEAIVLDEAAEPTFSDGTAASVVVKYTARAGWNTICLPFQMTTDDLEAIFGDDYQVYELSGYTGSELSFKASTSFAAGYAYIVHTDAPKNDVLFKQNVSLQTTTNSDSYTNTATGVTAAFYGTFAPMKAGDMEGKYGVTTDGRIMKGNADATMKGYRGYIDFSEPVSDVRIMLPNGEVITGINLNGNAETSAPAYNLQGQRVSTLGKGVYVIGGKKVVR